MIDEKVVIGGAGAAVGVLAAGNRMTRAEVDAEGGMLPPLPYSRSSAAEGHDLRAWRVPSVTALRIRHRGHVARMQPALEGFPRTTRSERLESSVAHLSGV
jgi:hypothetical protein